ncbi:unnamed protein product, partial [Choristocarpus tenellus]
QPYKVVTVWLYEGEELDVPWRALGDLVFEMGALSVSINGQGEREGAGGARLSFIIPGGTESNILIEAACGLLDTPESCYASLDWDEDPVPCLASWEALAEDAGEETGFATISCKKLQVVPVQRDLELPPGMQQVRVLEGEGWGNGEHPTTKMCLDFLEQAIKG